MQAIEVLQEAERVMGICNACRYCEGFCAVFPAMERRRTFADGDLIYLANLCHNCRGCYYACQYAPPHEFDMNVPKVLEEVRVETDGYVVDAMEQVVDHTVRHRLAIAELRPANGYVDRLVLGSDQDNSLINKMIYINSSCFQLLNTQFCAWNEGFK